MASNGSHQQNLQALFSRLKRVRNVSLGLGAVGTGVMIGSAYRPLSVATMTATVTVTTLSLSTAATAQLLLSLNTQLEALLNAPPEVEKSSART